LGIERWTEGISATFEHGKVKVKSESLGNEMWDLGRNSKRVGLFIYAFQEIEKSIDKEVLQQLVNEKKSSEQWDNYEIPDTLPKPEKVRNPNFKIPVVGSLIMAVLLAILLAKVTIGGFYVIGLFEFLVAISIGFAFKYLIEFSNFTNYKQLNQLLIGVTVFIYFLNIYFRYELIIYEQQYNRIGFYEFLKIQFSEGLIIKNTNTGWIGLLIHWILQYVLTYYLASVILVRNLTKYQLNRVPNEVFDFAFYLLIKDNNENQVRIELASKGWTNAQSQDEVFEAIGALHTSHEINRV
jgi:hypothetical protein